MSQFLGLEALRRVKLHLETSFSLRPEPLTIDALVLVGLPQVLQLDQLEPLGLEPVDVGQNSLRVALGTVGKRETDGIRNHAEYLPDVKRGSAMPGVRELFLQPVFALHHVLEPSQPPL